MRAKPKRHKPVTPRGPAFVPCEGCTNGWVVYHDALAAGPSFVARCWCWKIHQANLADSHAPEKIEATR